MFDFDLNDFELNHAELRATFLAEADEDLQAIEAGVLALEVRPDDGEVRAELLRLAHTLKGNASCVGLDPIATLAHAYEELLERVAGGELAIDSGLVGLQLAVVDAFRALLAAASSGDDAAAAQTVEPLVARLASWGGAAGADLPAAVQNGGVTAVLAGGRSLRVAADKLNRMLDLVGEIAIARGQVRARLLALCASNEHAGDGSTAIELDRQVDQLVGELQELVMRARMVSLGPTLRQYARTVRDLAEGHGKAARLVVAGEDVELDAAAAELLRDPLAHMIRNAVDHGVESPAERVAAGKPEVATLTLAASHEAGSIVLRLSDDGRGLDLAAIAARGRALGFEVDRLSEGELQRLIFAPGFSTAAEVTDLSGRGVGMDVVRRSVEALRGTIAIDSESGQGTRFTLRLPLTLAVIEGFTVGAGGETYVVPMECVLECRELPASEGRERPTGLLLRGDEVLPYVRLRRLFALPGEPPARENVLVVQHETHRAGLVVDELGGAGQAVIKPLGSYLPEVAGIAGSSILGSGRVALILDVPTILRRLERLSADDSRPVAGLHFPPSLQEAP